MADRKMLCMRALCLISILTDFVHSTCVRVYILSEHFRFFFL